MKLAIVTATTDLARALTCIRSWQDHAITSPKMVTVINGPKGDQPSSDSYLCVKHYLGTVSAFRQGVDQLLETDAEIIACLHDDFEIHEIGWDRKVIRHFERNPACGLLGFGGAVGLGDSDLYQKPYNPMSLARIGFRSNLVDAEQHGIRSLLPEKVACLDGFSQVGRRDFWQGLWSPMKRDLEARSSHPTPPSVVVRPWTYLEDLGIVHHFYDGALGCLARRYGWEVWYLPLRGQHFGGRTAVGDAGYQEWAKSKIPGGDQGFWEHAHKIAYDTFTAVLPIRV